MISSTAVALHRFDVVCDLDQLARGSIRIEAGFRVLARTGVHPAETEADEEGGYPAKSNQPRCLRDDRGQNVRGDDNRCTIRPLRSSGSA